MSFAIYNPDVDVLTFRIKELADNITEYQAFFSGEVGQLPHQPPGW